ncbi:hypothetical protein LOH54_09450 [Sulfurimonas sp. HSL-3221]|nr:hypothetical protein [Sulfurimonas sp. HSL-3221]UFS61879.1 hypothetical protein LOH54_09450 [Sulfurimonas sp. HSL-3221]
MQSKEAALKALDDGKELTSAVTGIKYKQMDGALYSKSSERSEWIVCGLMFYTPGSWLNLFE